MAVKQSVKQECFNDAVPLPTYVDSRAIGAGAAETFTVPADGDFMVITANAGATDIYVDRNKTAAVPGDLSDGTASFCIPISSPPTRFQVDRGSTFSVFCVAAGVVTVAYYRRT